MSHVYSESSRFSLDNTKPQEYFLLAGPFIALIGNSPSDIWLTLVAIFFVIHSVLTRNWTWTKTAWFRISLIFWAWIILVSAISEWPGNALQQALPWIRFPVFASAMIYWLSNSARLWKHMLYAVIAGTLLLATILIIERFLNPDAIRLYGTWTQSTKPGWYMLGIGLPVVLWSLLQLKENAASAIWSIPLILFIFCATVSTGEIYITISMIFASALFVLFSRFWNRYSILLASLCLTAAIAVLTTNQDLFYRFTGEILVRLPWLPTSDYYDAWTGGLNTGLKNALLGIGVDNYEFYCKALKAKKALIELGVNECMVHPHNIYIQAFAETGIVGLFLLSALAISLHLRVLKGVNLLKITPVMATAIAIIILVFWPVSTYSQAFGQHKNMFTWFLIGWAIATASLAQKQKRLPD